jgi:alanine-glyoxylate transaminase/serine-glyoxylate transaminase/serine-pyruvate transaminase
MGHVNAHMVLGVLASLQAGMAALQIPHGPTGLEAAMKVIAEAG